MKNKKFKNLYIFNIFNIMNIFFYSNVTFYVCSQYHLFLLNI